MYIGVIVNCIIGNRSSSVCSNFRSLLSPLLAAVSGHGILVSPPTHAEAVLGVWPGCQRQPQVVLTVVVACIWKGHGCQYT